ncbi:hypothetical protein [Paucibacter soli]|uniref:hypothetical protein n=1 Tax=Paucibacter soli TaxID=3133433 RepID=UPI00309A91D8
MERTHLFAKKTSGNARPETFAIKVIAYDTTGKQHMVHGKRLDNGEEVSVYLRDVEYERRSSFKRSEIKDFAAPRKDRQHPGTAPEGILLIQEAFPQGDNKFGARWIQSLSHTKGEAEVFMATVHVSPVKRGNAKSADFPEGRPYSLMTVLHDGDFRHLSDEMADALKLQPPFQVQNTAELKQALTELLSDGIGAGVRLSSSAGFDAMYVGRSRDSSPDDDVAAFMKEIEPMQEAVDSGEFACEVIPYGNVWAGPKTTDVMMANKVVQNRLKQFNQEAVSDAGRSYTLTNYRPAIVAVRLTDPGADGKRAVFFSHFEPLWTRQPTAGLVNAICYAQTDVLSPEPPKPTTANAVNPTEPEARGEVLDSGFGSFDASDDLMGAAGGPPGQGGDHDIGDDIPAGGAPAASAANEGAEQAAPGRRYRRGAAR